MLGEDVKCVHIVERGTAMKSQEIFEELKKSIDSAVYTEDVSKEIKKYNVSEDFTVDWKDSLPKPPVNSSKITHSELLYLSELTENISVAQKALVELVDKEPLDLFEKTIRNNNLKVDKEGFKKLWKVSRPVVMRLKYLFNRPRPEQLAPYFGLKVNVIETSTHHTPAYPSGHTCYTAMAAHLFSAQYPEFSNEFFSQPGIAGYARCLQGVHYPSDNDAAMTISSVIWEDLKFKMFPELFTRGE